MPELLLSSLPPEPPLSIELVPESLWQVNLHHLLSRKQWQQITRDTIVDAAGRCEICGERTKRSLECHEQWHYDDTNHLQTLTGTIALCAACHQVKHWGLSKKRGLGEQALQHLLNINGWTDEQAFEHIDNSFKIWQERSKHKWRQDLSWLSRNYPDMEIRFVKRR